MTASRICHVCGAGNPPNARYCNQCGTFLDLALGPVQSTTEERRWVTVLFADLVSSTALLEHMDPEDARDLIVACFDRLARDIAGMGGTVDKFMGDAVMALFGAPIAHEDDPARALRAAFQMQASMARFNAEQHLALDLRIGVNTGQVVVGARQVGGLAEYTATGDAVNVAARLQQIAQPGQIVAGEATVRQLGNGFRLRALSSTHIRGKQDPVTVYLIEGQSQEAFARASSEVPLVNRRRELARLGRVLDQLVQGRGRIVMVTGEPGIGKSRLIAEARRLAPPGIRWTEGRARSDGATLNYHVFRTMIDQLFDLGDESGAAAGANHLRHILEGLGTPQAFPFLAQVAELPTRPIDYETLEHLPPEQVEQRAIRDLSAMVEAGARRRPGVLALDDLHWADPASLALIGGFLPLVARVPLVLILSFRDEAGLAIGAIRDRARQGLSRWTTELNIQPLTPRQTAQLVTAMLGARTSTVALRVAVHEKAEGNPLFVEEILRSLTASNLLDDTGSVAAMRLPVSIQGIILSRVDLLPDATRQALQVAAVVGREFDASLLQRMDADISAEVLQPALEAEIIIRNGSDARGQYAFRHALTREAIYRTLLLRRRRELHARLAEALVASLPDPADESALLAFHFGQARRWAELLTYATLAGDQAGRAFASADAINHYSQALEALAHLDELGHAGHKAELLRSRARAYERTGEWQRGKADYEQAVQTVTDPAVQESILLSLARLLTDHDDYAAALLWTDQALQLARVTGDRRGYARALSMEARILVRKSQAQQAVDRLTEALAVHREIGDRRGEAVALDNLAAPLSLLGDVLGAYERQHAALEIYRELGDQERQGDVLSVLAEWLWFRGEFRSALDTAREARAIHESLVVHRYQAHDRLVEGMALASLGRFREAASILNEAVHQAEQLEHPEWVAHALVPLGVAYRSLHRLRRARQAFTRAAELGDRIGARLWAQLGRVGLGFTALQEGQFDEAEVCFRTVLSAPEGLQYPRACAMTGLAMLELDRGNPQLADDWVRWSIAISEGAPYMEALLEARIVQGRILVSQGQREAGIVLLEDVQMRARFLGARPLQASARRALAGLRSESLSGDH
ncbi:MAG: AAA family ATPase [Chloroflexota bacterium]